MAEKKPTSTQLTARTRVGSRATANIVTRYRFTAQFLRASAVFASRCEGIELAHPDHADDGTMTEHRGLVVATIMQSVAAVETESAELTMHGPGSHLGSDGLNKEASAFLAPLSEFIDTQDILTRYDLILWLLKKSSFDRGASPYQDMKTLIRLRNEITHYKSRWHDELERKTFFTNLQRKFPKPSFMPANTTFFPHRCLSAACAWWSVGTSVAFLNNFYERLEIVSPLAPFMQDLNRPRA